MNRKDREFIDRLDHLVRTVGTLTPRNPADVAAISANLRTAVLVSKCATQAIACVRADDLDGAEYHLAQAEATLRDAGLVP